MAAAAAGSDESSKPLSTAMMNAKDLISYPPARRVRRAGDECQQNACQRKGLEYPSSPRTRARHGVSSRRPGCRGDDMELKLRRSAKLHDLTLGRPPSVPGPRSQRT